MDTSRRFESKRSIFGYDSSKRDSRWEESVPCLNTFQSETDVNIEEKLADDDEVSDPQKLLQTNKSSTENLCMLRDECFMSKHEQTLEQVRKRLEDASLTPHEILFGKNQNTAKLKRSYLKNLMVLSFCFMLVFSAFFSLRNLQTSVNRRYSLGLFSLACMNATFAVGCVLANTIIQKVRPKRVIALMLVGNSLYVASNFYPSFVTLVPATLLLGFTMANLLVAESTYLTSIAVSYASAANKRPDHIISAFNGYFLFMMYLAHFVGNLLSSAVFYLFSSTQADQVFIYNSTDQSYVLINSSQLENCGFKHYQLPDEELKYSVNVDAKVIYILVAIFMFITLQAHLLIALFLDKLDVIFYKSKVGLKSQVCEIWKLHVDPKMKFMLPLMIYLGFQEAFIYADFTNAYITCSIGLHMIGFVMMAFSAMDSISSFLCGYLRRFVAQSCMVAFGSILNLVILIFLYFWKPVPGESRTIFLVAAALGIVDGIWQTLTNSLCGILFSSRQRVAVFSSLRMYQALGFTIASIYSHFIYNEVKIAIVMALLVVSSFSFIGLEIHTSKHQSQDLLNNNNNDVTPSSIKTSSR